MACALHCNVARVLERVSAHSLSTVIGPAFLLACFVTATAVIVSSVASAALGSWLQQRRHAVRLDARWTEAGLLAAAAQRWAQTPAAWGGPARPEGWDFSEVTLAALGASEQTRVGTYHLFPIPARRWSTRWTGDRDETPGLLVVGAAGPGEQAVAVLAVGGLSVYRLPRVPAACVRALAAPPAPAPAPAETLVVARPTRVPARRPRPTRHRRTPRPSTQRLPARHLHQAERSYARSASHR